MPDCQLHADYDHDGRISRHPDEYSRRLEAPGGILLANLDADDRRAPGSVADGSPVVLDYQRTVKHSSDNDLLRIVIRIVQPSVPNADRFYLRTLGWLGDKVRICDSRDRQLRGLPTMPNVYPISFANAETVLKLEAQTLPGTPLYMPSSLRRRSGPPVYLQEERVILDLYYFDAGGRYTCLDRACFTLAPMILIDNTCRAESAYICEIESPTRRMNGLPMLENHPTIADFESAMNQIGVPLVKVQHRECQRDGWLQDQFKIGYCHAPNGFMHMVLHFPRMRSNIVRDALVTSNLARFVRAYFPSSGIGLFHDFWERRVRFQDADFNARLLLFYDSQEVLLIIRRLFDFRGVLINRLNRLRSGEVGRRERFVSIGEALVELPSLVRLVSHELEQASSRATTDGLRELLEREINDIQERYRSVLRSVNLQGDRIALQTAALGCEMTADGLTQLFERLDQMHDGFNYGGNIEVSPPVPGAPFGKLLIGNGRILDRELVDPEIRVFFVKQRVQPLVEIDTGWLQVGHVDELITFVPCSLEGHDFAILRASPAIALRILYEAVRRHYQGLRPDRSTISDEMLEDCLENHVPGNRSRRNVNGVSPVTHMLRGQRWLHHHPRGTYALLEPPVIYREMVNFYLRAWGGNYQEFPYRPGEGDDRFYPANISVFDFLVFEGGTNADIEAFEIGGNTEDGDESGEQWIPFLAAMDSTLDREFPGVPVVKLPVLFDAVSDWTHDATVAFTPNLVNMQAINGHVILPRPYGPRMNVDDATVVLRQVFESISASGCVGRLGERYFRNRNMIGINLWRNFGRIRDVAREFVDGFPRRSYSEIEQIILRANRRSGVFSADGVLRRGWHKIIIPEETVDLFEAYSQIILESIGLQVHWADSWFYHVQLGEIHCGTNVKRSPGIDGRAPWWRSQSV